MMSGGVDVLSGNTGGVVRVYIDPNDDLGRELLSRLGKAFQGLAPSRLQPISNKHAQWGPAEVTLDDGVTYWGGIEYGDPKITNASTSGREVRFSDLTMQPMPWLRFPGGLSDEKLKSFFESCSERECTVTHWLYCLLATPESREAGADAMSCGHPYDSGTKVLWRNAAAKEAAKSTHGIWRGATSETSVEVYSIGRFLRGEPISVHVWGAKASLKHLAPREDGKPQTALGLLDALRVDKGTKRLIVERLHSAP